VAKPTNRVAWGLAVVLTAGVVAAVGMLGVQLRPYWVAKYRGREADLRGAALPYAPLAGAELDSAVLAGADLSGANLRGAFLRALRVSRWPTDPDKGCSVVDLTGARLVGADLTGAHLMAANLTGGFLSDATFNRAHADSATFRQADLRRARFRGADLHNANFCGADLTDADLSGARLKYAHYDAHTRWPQGFDPQRHGAVKVP
jgi:uncharacterized protein YjbI with pentapeptide repeats